MQFRCLIEAMAAGEIIGYGDLPLIQERIRTMSFPDEPRQIPNKALSRRPWDRGRPVDRRSAPRSAGDAMPLQYSRRRGA